MHMWDTIKNLVGCFPAVSSSSVTQLNSILLREIIYSLTYRTLNIIKRCKQTVLELSKRLRMGKILV